MTMEVVARRFVASLLIVLMLGSVLLGLGQATRGLSRDDQTKIIESVLQLEVRVQNSEFESIRNLSTDNIEFVDRSRISGSGFTLITADYIRTEKVDHMIDYVVLGKISSRDGKVFVNLSRMHEGRPCFGPASSRERSFTYEYRKESGEWVGRLVGRTPRTISAPWNWNVSGDRSSIRADPVFGPIRWFK
jgi:hypothetical protein